MTPESIVQRQLDAYNARDIDGLMATYAEDAQQYEYPSTLLASGAAQLSERFTVRFSEPNLHARLINRIVMGEVVIDHEEVTQTFPEGTGKVELVAIYEVRNGRIVTARFIPGKKTLDDQGVEATPSGQLAYAAVSDADFEELAALRIAAMQASLEAVGRFNPDRARERLRNSFYPDHTAFILLDGRRVGFYTFRPAEKGFQLDHLYVHPSCQSRGIGSQVIRHLLSQSDARQMPVSLGALRDSPSNRFYQRHGFVQTAEDEWDIYYVRAPRQVEAGNSTASSGSRPS